MTTNDATRKETGMRLDDFIEQEKQRDPEFAKAYDAETARRAETDDDAVYDLAVKIAAAWGHADAFELAFNQNIYIGIRRRALKAANVALAAVEQAAAGDKLDAMLDSVHPRAIIRSVGALPGGGWEACISVPEGPDSDGWYDYTDNQSVGSGPTRIAAIQDAVEKEQER